MSIVMSDNFDGAPGGTFLSDAYFTANTSLSLVASRFGVAVRIPAATIAYLTQATFTGTTGPRVFSRIYKLSAAPTAVAQIFQVRSSGGAICTASIRTDGKLALHNTGSTGTVLAQTTASVPIGTEFRVVYTVNGTSFSATIYPDTTSTTPTQTIGPVTITGGTMVTTREGQPNAGGIVGATLDIAWPVDDDATDPGVRQYVRLDPSTVTGFAPKAITATVYDEGFPAGTKVYTVAWGDGATTGPQSSASFSHTFTAAGTYQMVATVDVT